MAGKSGGVSASQVPRYIPSCSAFVSDTLHEDIFHMWFLKALVFFRITWTFLYYLGVCIVQPYVLDGGLGLRKGGILEGCSAGKFLGRTHSSGGLRNSTLLFLFVLLAYPAFLVWLVQFPAGGVKSHDFFFHRLFFGGKQHHMSMFINKFFFFLMGRAFGMAGKESQGKTANESTTGTPPSVLSTPWLYSLLITIQGNQDDAGIKRSTSKDVPVPQSDDSVVSQKGATTSSGGVGCTTLNLLPPFCGNGAGPWCRHDYIFPLSLRSTSCVVRPFAFFLWASISLWAGLSYNKKILRLAHLEEDIVEPVVSVGSFFHAYGRVFLLIALVKLPAVVCLFLWFPKRDVVLGIPSVLSISAARYGARSLEGYLYHPLYIWAIYPVIIETFNASRAYLLAWPAHVGPKRSGQDEGIATSINHPATIFPAAWGPAEIACNAIIVMVPILYCCGVAALLMSDPFRRTWGWVADNPCVVPLWQLLRWAGGAIQNALQRLAGNFVHVNVRGKEI